MHTHFRLILNFSIQFGSAGLLMIDLNVAGTTREVACPIYLKLGAGGSKGRNEGGRVPPHRSRSHCVTNLDRPQGEACRV